MNKLPLCCAASVAISAAGCAKVDFRQNYDAVQHRAAAATGAPEMYRPDREQEARAYADRLLADGLTVDEAVQVCLLHNPRLMAAAMNVGMAKADVVQSGLLSNPVLGLSLLAPSGGGLVNLQADLAQNVAELWQIPARRGAAEADLDAAILQLARSATELAAEAKSAYYEAVGAEQAAAIAVENVELIRSVYAAAVARRDAGAGADLDVNLAEGPVIEAELAVSEARLAAGEARRRLARLLGLAGPASEIVLLDPLPEAFGPVADAEDLVELAEGARLDIQVAARAAEAAGRRFELERQRVFPNVQLGVGIERDERRREGGRNLVADTARASIANGRLTAPEIQPRSARTQRQNTITGPTLSLALPVFDQNQAQVAKAELAWRRALAALVAVERETAQEVRGAADRARTAWEIVAVYRTRSLPLAEKNVALARDSYAAGKASLLAVLEAEQFFLRTRTQYIASLTKAAATIPELEAAVNAPFPAIVAATRRSTDAPVEEGQREEVP